MWVEIGTAAAIIAAFFATLDFFTNRRQRNRLMAFGMLTVTTRVDGDEVIIWVKAPGRAAAYAVTLEGRGCRPLEEATRQPSEESIGVTIGVLEAGQTSGFRWKLTASVDEAWIAFTWQPPLALSDKTVAGWYPAEASNGSRSLLGRAWQSDSDFLLSPVKGRPIYLRLRKLYSQVFRRSRAVGPGKRFQETWTREQQIRLLRKPGGLLSHLAPPLTRQQLEELRKKYPKETV